MRYCLAIAALALICAPAVAECVQCPSPPCEIQACPPNDVEIFAELKINGVKTGLGQQVEIVDGLLLSVHSIADAGGLDADVVFAVQVSDAQALAGHAFYLEREKYNLVNGSWQYAGTEQEPVVLFETPMVEAGDCVFFGQSCEVGSQGECASDYCSTATYCPEPYAFCLVASGWCEDSSSQCTGCSTGDLTCPDMDDYFPLPTLRVKICPEYTSKCRFSVIDIAEG